MVIPIDELSREVIGISMRLHTALGPGLFESVYEAVLCGKLQDKGLRVDRQRFVDIEFEGKIYGNAMKIDLLVDERLVIEVKSKRTNSELDAQQLLTYLRLTNLSVGLVINFGLTSLKEGIRRVVNNHIDSASSAFSA